MFVAGSYVAFYREQFLGQVQEGFLLEWSPEAEPVVGDYWGGMVQDVITQAGNMYISFTCLEADLSVVQQLMWPQPPAPQAGAQTVPFGIWMQPGTVWKQLGSSSLQLVARPGTNATPTNIVFPYVVCQPGYTIRVFLSSSLRRVPIRLMILPVTVESHSPQAQQFPFGGIGMVAYGSGLRSLPTFTQQTPQPPG